MQAQGHSIFLILFGNRKYIVILTFNEERGIAKVLEELRWIGLRNILVVEIVTYQKPNDFHVTMTVAVSTTASVHGFRNKLPNFCTMQFLPQRSRIAIG